MYKYYVVTSIATAVFNRIAPGGAAGQNPRLPAPEAQPMAGRELTTLPPWRDAHPLTSFALVPGARIELATPASSGQRSTNELPRHARHQSEGDELPRLQNERSVIYFNEPLTGSPRMWRAGTE